MENKERIQKLIAARGHCSRRKAEELITQGKVFVDGEQAHLGDTASSDAEIRIGSLLLSKEPKTYLALNKPPGYECTLKGSRTIQTLIPSNQRIFPVGRLDKDARGLLLLTNDGEFANKVMHPRYEQPRTYQALLDKKVQKGDIQKINKGIRLKDGKVYAKAKQIGPKTIRLTLHVGKKHIVKRLLFKLGYYVKDLKRVQIGAVRLNIPEGKYRPLTEREKEQLLSVVPRPRVRTPYRALRGASGSRT